eukprot:TRINITY_DN93534_c0_g1_i1.p1 TRINITY_DN93534_c0_g1~~TRINITY_DN93534_c0_g1_i1.p1  ORF type:complete len:556 (-),score=111.99 TRINITY_DN93534_c0_g1_i1:17-1684(-)
MGKKSRGSPGADAGEEVSARRQRERSSGEYDWPALFKIEEEWAKAKGSALPKGASATLEVASFCDSRLQLRLVPGRGRGLLASAPVAEGELLYACRAFSIAPRAELQAAVVERLRSCSEADFERFCFLQDDSTAPSTTGAAEQDLQGWLHSEPASSKPSKPRAVNAERVAKVLGFNSIARDALDKHGSAPEAPLSGLWLLPSLVNHSCRPNLQQFFLGDLLVARATKPLAAGEELLVAYVSTLQPRHVRRQKLSEVFCFQCNCPRCTLEAKLFPEAKAKAILEELDSLVEKAASRQLPDLADELSKLSQRARRESAESAKRLEQASDLHEACSSLWGSSGASHAELSPRLERLLSGSFLAAFMGGAFARKQLGETEQVAEAYDSCCQLLAEVCPGSAYHAHWALEAALQANLSASASRGVLASRALRWCRAFAGPDPAVFELLAKRIGWPTELLELARSAPAEAPAALEETSSSPWEYTLDEVDGGSMMLSISLPEGLGPADVDLDVAPEKVSVAAGNGLPPLVVSLPRQVNPAAVPAAKYKRKGNRLLLELPTA